MDSSHSRLTAADSRCSHQDSSTDHRDTEHHWEATYPHSSQTVHSMTRNAHCCYKFLLPHHTWCHWDNSATCQSNTQPVTANDIGGDFWVKVHTWRKVIIKLINNILFYVYVHALCKSSTITKKDKTQNMQQKLLERIKRNSLHINSWVLCGWVRD